MFLFSLFLCQLWPLHCERKLEVSSKYFLSGGNININTNIGVSLSLFAFLTISKERIDISFKRLFWNIATFPLSCNLTSVPFNNLIPISYYTTPYHIKSYRSFWMGQQELLFLQGSNYWPRHPSRSFFFWPQTILVWENDQKWFRQKL